MIKKLLKLFFILYLPVILFAGTTGKIAGTVTSKDTGEPLAGVNVILKGTGLGSATDQNGQYYILNTPPGLYELEASYIGYATYTVSNIFITVDITTTIDVEMETEAIKGQTVTVVAERPLIEKKATNERRIIRREDIENIPVRDTQSMIATQTGAVKVGNQMYIRGGRAEEVAYYVDGVYQVNDFNRANRPDAAEISSQAMEEVSFQAGGFDAEYGSANSGLVAMSTKTGGRNFQISGEVATDDFLSRDKAILGTYSYGKQIANLAVSGPLAPNLSFYANLEKQNDYDHAPTSAKHPEATYIGDPDSMNYSTYEDYVVKSVYGPQINNGEDKLLGTGNILFSKEKLRIKVGGNFNIDNLHDYNYGGQPFAPYDVQNIYLWKSMTTAAYGKVTMAINPKTMFNVQVSYFRDYYERANPNYWDDYLYYGTKNLLLKDAKKFAAMSDADFNAMFQNEASTMRKILADTASYGRGIVTKNDTAYAAYVLAPQLANNGSDPSAKQEYANFLAPGTVNGIFQKNETAYIGINSDLKAQVGNHEMKFGLDMRYYTIRYYALGAPERLSSSLFGNLPVAPADYTDTTVPYNTYINNYWEQAYKYAYAENMGYDIYGRAAIDKPLGEDRNSARRPIVAGLYFQDKVELKDLIMNLGLRWDYINTNNYVFRDPYTVITDSLGNIAENVYKNEKGEYKSYSPTYELDGETPIDLVGRKQLVKRDALNYLSPRLGLAFPVTDRTAFHAQYGKYVQQPRLSNLFLSYTRFSANLQQGNYTVSGNPQLEPVRTTSYEMGFKQQFGTSMSLDATIFYKQMTGYVQIRNLDGAFPIVYANYQNGDYGTVKGLSFSFNMRRVGYVRAFVNYTLQYASGTGSSGTSVSTVAWQGGNFPTFTSPLDFDQRHTGSVNLDFRTTKRDLIKNAGVNFLFSFGSGRRYTPIKMKSYLFSSTGDVPTAGINSGVMPWTYNLDMKMNKNIEFGPVKLNAYLLVKNLLGRVNVVNVHPQTGMATNDGWLETLEGLNWLANPATHKDLYILAVQNVDYFDAPRTVLAGLEFFIGK